MKTPYFKVWALLLTLFFSRSLQAQVTASFTVSTKLPCSGTTVYFTNTSTNAAQYEWDFGDWGDLDVSSAANPSYSYGMTGNTSVRLIAINGADRDTAYAPIGIGGYPFFSLYYVNPSEPRCVNAEVAIQGYGFGVDYVTWIWRDGDTSYTSGSTHLGKHKYSAPGSYWVKTITHTTCYDIYDSINVIIVSGNNCSLNLIFYSSYYPICKGSLWLFYMESNQLSGPLDSLRWLTSDGQTATTPVFYPVFNQEGDIRITLKGWRGNKMDSVYETVTISDTLVETTLQYVYTQPYNFQRRTHAPIDIAYSGHGTAYRYSFGDGTPDQRTYASMVQHAFDTAGVYEVVIYGYTGCGNVPDSGVAYITIADTFDWENSIIMPTTYCPGEQTYLTLGGMDTLDVMWYIDTDSVAGNRAVWVFNTPGSYYVKYRFSDYNGGYAFDSVLIQVGNRVASGELSGSPATCPSSPVLFQYSGRDKVISIDFGDGNQVSNPSFPLLHQFTTEGVYPVLYTLQNHCGNTAAGSYSVTVSQHITDENFVSPYIFDCKDAEIVYYGIPTDSTRVFFGDGTDSILPPLSTWILLHAYDEPGEYVIKFVKLHGCAGEYGDTVYSYARIFDALHAQMVFSEDTLFVGDTLSVTNISGYGGFANTYWYINDEQPGIFSLNQLKWVFDEPGEYTVTLFLLTTRNCTADTTLHVTVLEPENNITYASLSEARERFKLYPNPTGTSAMLEYPVLNSGEGALVSITDLSGREIWKTPVDASGTQLLPLEQLGLSAGIYLVRFEQGSEVLVARLAFQR